jgi:signal transduction histidine kinase
MRIATDLHDDIGSSLSQIAILSEVARQQMGRGDMRATEPLSMIASASRELVDSMSDIVWAINPRRDRLNDLVQRMRRFASDIFTARDIQFSFRTSEFASGARVGADTRRQVFLIFKESINNAARHSGCTEADIEFGMERDWLVLTLKDNGKGFDRAEVNEGHGLMSMCERARELGGTLELTTEPGRGTVVTLRVPVGRYHPTLWRKKHRLNR